MVSAAISEGPSHRIMQAWLRDQRFELVICDRMIQEVQSVLTERPRLRRWISLEAAALNHQAHHHRRHPTRPAAGTGADPRSRRRLRDPSGACTSCRSDRHRRHRPPPVA
ncbi:MAG: hypothetical protein ACE5MI_10985 [Acidimicrobiia bacterium]